VYFFFFTFYDFKIYFNFIMEKSNVYLLKQVVPYWQRAAVYTFLAFSRSSKKGGSVQHVKENTVVLLSNLHSITHQN
jgi:hypothetical protein